MPRVWHNIGEHVLRYCLVVGHALGEPVPSRVKWWHRLAGQTAELSQWAPSLDVAGNLWATFCVDRGEDQCCNLQTSFPGTQKYQEIHWPSWHLWLWELHCEQVWSLQKENQVLILLHKPKLKVLQSFHLSWSELDWVWPGLFLYEKFSELTNCSRQCSS